MIPRVTFDAHVAYANLAVCTIISPRALLCIALFVHALHPVRGPLQKLTKYHVNTTLQIHLPLSHLSRGDM